MTAKLFIPYSQKANQTEQLLKKHFFVSMLISESDEMSMLRLPC